MSNLFNLIWMARKIPPILSDFFKNLPPEAINFFRKEGKKGGKAAAKSMTPEERVARAKKASDAAAKSMTPEERKARARKAAAASAKARKARKKNVKK